MFEKYTERARRVIFFARYEASVQFGSMTIESEHLLLGLVREDKHLLRRFLGNQLTYEDILAEVQARVVICDKVSGSIDTPLSGTSQRILADACGEAKRMSDTHIGTEHLLLGILRAKDCVAAEILIARGLHLDVVRERLTRFKYLRDKGVFLANPIRHIEFWVSSMERALGFYEPLFALLGWERIDQNSFGAGGAKIYFREVAAQLHGDVFGPRHICFRAKDRNTVDAIAKLLASRENTILHGPEEMHSSDTYMLVFDDSDGYILEVAHTDEEV